MLVNGQHVIDSCCCWVAQLCPAVCDPMECGTQGCPGHHCLSEFAQTPVHWVRDAIQPSHPLSPSSSPALHLSQHYGLFQWLALHIRWLKYWSFSFSISPSSEYSGSISFRMNWLDLLCCSPTQTLTCFTSVYMVHGGMIGHWLRAGKSSGWAGKSGSRWLTGVCGRDIDKCAEITYQDRTFTAWLLGRSHLPKENVPVWVSVKAIRWTCMLNHFASDSFSILCDCCPPGSSVHGILQARMHGSPFQYSSLENPTDIGAG